MDEINATILSMIIVGLIPIIILIPLSHASGLGDLNSDVTKNNNGPVIVISHNVRAIEGQLVPLDASKSFDPDGDPLKFSWEKISPDDTKVNLLDDKSPVASFLVPPLKSKVVILFEVSIFDGNGNTDTDQIHVIASNKVDSDKKQAQLIRGESEHVNKKDQADKERTKSSVLSSTDGKLKSQGRADSKQASLSEHSRRSPSFADNTIKVNAGDDMEVAGGTIVKLNGKLLSKPDSNQIKLSWTQKKGPRLQLSSNDVLDPLFIAPQVEKNERIEFELHASDQNGFTDSDNMKVIVLANSSKELDKGQSVGPLSTKQFGSASTSDTKPPTVVSTTPTNGARGVPITSKIMATFSEPILSSSITSSTFTLKISGSTSYVTGTRSLSSSDGYKTAIFALSSNLKPSTTYVATLTRGVRDQAGNAMTIPKTWWFTTASDTTPPTVIGTSPASGATGVLVTSSITATFSEPVQSWSSTTIFTVKNGAGTSFPGTLALSTDHKTVTFTHSSSFASSTSYTVTVTTGVKDIAGNAMASAKSWSFTTAAGLLNSYDDFEAGTYTMGDNQKSPNGKWTTAYTGFGQVGVKEESGGNNILYEFPKTSTQSGETHSSLVLSTQKFSNSIIEFNMRTDKQLRQNSPPNTWETGWIMWRFADDFHHYYFVLKTNGIEFGKKDNNCNCEQQVFLNTGTSPKLVLNQWAHIKISSIGKHTTIWVNTGGGDVKVVDMDDPSYNSAQMSGGVIGLYNEDASVAFDNVKITPQ
ncbi:MAG: Ig-like domain-containing protein [Thermoproteota archaeon]|nr:Ig-like domain-containing protein [Thermoproteota archaeon]